MAFVITGDAFSPSLVMYDGQGTRLRLLDEWINDVLFLETSNSKTRKYLTGMHHATG